MGIDKPTAADPSSSLQQSRARLQAAAAKAHAATRAWARERELQQGHTAEMTARVKQSAQDINAMLDRAERLADAVMRPRGVWEEAGNVVDEGTTQVPPESGDGVFWVLEETAEICEMLLQDGPDGAGDSVDVVARIDSVLEALGDDGK